MRTEKLSISIPGSSFDFIEKYRKTHALKSRSHVIETAINVLRERDLEAAYRDASREYDPAWEVTNADGLPDEAW